MAWFGDDNAPMPVDFRAARQFVYANGRLLEQLEFECLFEGGDPAAVARAVLAYQSADGGFGHGLEPDKRAPGSQPLDVEVALEHLVTVGAATAPDVVAAAERACDWLSTVTDDATGLVPIVLPSIARYPLASHWSASDTFPPSINPTASIAGLLLALGIDHPWVGRAVDACVSSVQRDGAPDEAHALLCVTRLSEQLADGDQVQMLTEAVIAALPSAALFQPVPHPTEYGVTPLQFAPAPASPARAWFADDAIEAHLDQLEGEQQPDGGWPIRWDPPGDASRCEWRTMRTVDALRVLRAYGRLG